MTHYRLRLFYEDCTFSLVSYVTSRKIILCCCSNQSLQQESVREKRSRASQGNPSWVYMPSISCGQRWSLAFGPASSWGCSDGGSPPLRPQSSLQKPMRIKSKTAAEKQGGFVRAIFIGMASSFPRCLRVVASHSDVLGPSRLVELVYHGTLISAISHPAV